ncbi:MAG: SGNH/GDSL hydrolase family protein [Capsulimonadaceae bacterium]|nr:SGNH/GDSL hydrolase family protein [Capsulimonadaceae bacterium]
MSNSKQTAEPGAVTNAAALPDAERSKLPNVLIIGDSISLGYTDNVRKLLEGRANVYRSEGNAGPTSTGIAHVDDWISAHDVKWDVIHFNFGLHDLKVAPNTKEAPYPGGHQVTEADYEKNLRQIVARLKATSARLIFATTTPVPAGKLDPPRRTADVLEYNAIATKVMAENGIAIDDLYGIALPILSTIQQHENVHFTDEGSATLAKAVVASILPAL